jgi:hypothetical protein
MKGGKLKKGQLHLTEYVKKHRSADPEHCSLASSLYYGGPDEHYDSLQTTQVDQDEVNFNSNSGFFHNLSYHLLLYVR